MEPSKVVSKNTPYNRKVKKGMTGKKFNRESSSGTISSHESDYLDDTEEENFIIKISDEK